MTEAAITRKILHTLRALPDTWAMKIHGSQYQDVGTPDILGCHQGRMFALEVKRPGKRPTVVQAATLSRWAEAGAVVAVVHDVDEALRALGIGGGRSPATPWPVLWRETREPAP